MKISGVKIPAGVTITAPTPAQAPSGPSKFVVGAPFNDDDSGESSGSVYVYNLDGTGELKITASDAAADDYFGYSVAATNTHIVVGAYGDDDAGSKSGSAYVYNLDGTGEVKITASDGASEDYFGSSVAIHGDKIIVGANGNSDAGSASGSAYVYNTDGTGEQKITASDGTQNDRFGESVAISDTYIVVGAPYDNGIRGSAYVYNLDGTGEVKITASDGAAVDIFGQSVAISDTKLVVGAYADDDAGSSSGSVYVYNLDGTGEVKITASDAAGGDGFGRSVAISDTHIVVGASVDNGARGSAYVYNLDGTGEVKITASDAAADDRFGWSVAIQGDKIIVGGIEYDQAGTNTGSVYVYNTDGTGEQKITASDSASNDQFGRSVAIN